MKVILSILLLLLPTAAAAAEFTFTAVERIWLDEIQGSIGSFKPDSTLTVTVSTNSDEAVIRVPGRFFKRYAWSPPTAIIANGQQARDGDCNSPLLLGTQDEPGHCYGPVYATMLPDGRAELRVPRAWFLEAASVPYLIQDRFDTCRATGGAIDILYPWQRCPTVDEGKPSPTNVTRPYHAWLLRISYGRFDWGKEFLFLAGTELAQLLTQRFNPEEHQPKEAHYGELEWLYSWIASRLPEDPAPAEEESCTCP